MDRKFKELLDVVDSVVTQGFKSQGGADGGIAVKSKTDYTGYCRSNKPQVARYLTNRAGGRYMVRVTDALQSSEFAVCLEVTRPGKTAQKYGVQIFTTPDGYCSINLVPLQRNLGSR